MAGRQKSDKKRKVSVPADGIAHVHSSFNNTIITITDRVGNVVAASSGGAAGFKNARKGTPFATQTAADKVGQQVKDMGMSTVSVRVRGPGPGREAAIRALGATGLQIVSIADVTPLPHNGCRPPKKRRG